MLKSFVIGGLAAMLLALTVQAEERIQFPAGYEDKMLNYLSLDHTQNDDQVIRLFATKNLWRQPRPARNCPMAQCLSPNSIRPRKTPMVKSLKSPSADVYAANSRLSR